MKGKFLLAKLFIKIRKFEEKLLAKYMINEFDLPKSTQIIKGKLKFSGDISCGENCCFFNGVTITAGNKVSIGRYTSISGPNTDIVNSIFPIKIGSFCSIARNVTIQEFNHNPENFTTYYIEQNLLKKKALHEKASKGPIVIGNDVWIGAQCVILSGAEIGDGAIIAANSVVTGKIPPYAIVGGTPAKVIKYRFSDNKIKKLVNSDWFNNITAENYEEYSNELNNIN